MRLAAVLAFSLVTVGGLRPVHACDSAIFREMRRGDELYVQDLLDRLEKADEKLDAGKADEAYTDAVAVLADRHFQRAATLRKAKAHRIAAQAALALGKNDEAVAHFSVAVEALPELAAGLATAQIAAGHLDDARNQLESRSAVHLLDASGWMLLARLRRELGDSAGAKAAVAEVLHRNPDSHEAIRLQGQLAGPTALAASTSTAR
jgi:predicted Zn-dependent protease